MNKIDVEFDFNKAHYFSIARPKELNGSTEYDITILDWNLERLLYGNHIIKELNGSLQVGNSFKNLQQAQLKSVIALALSSYLKMPCFVGEQCLAPKLPGEDSGRGIHASKHYKSRFASLPA